MIVTPAEIKTFLGLASSITAEQASLLDLVQPLAESALRSYLQTIIGRAQTTEYLPIGQPQNFDNRTALADLHKSGNSFVFSNFTPGRNSLQLKNTPVLITDLQIYEDVGAYANQSATPFEADSLLTLGTDYYLDCDEPGVSRTGIVRRVGEWPLEPRCVKAVYWGGFSDAQLASANGDIKLAAMYVIAKTFKTASQQIAVTGGLQGSPILTSETIGKWSGSTSAAMIEAFSVNTSEIPPNAKELLQPYRNYGRIFS